MSSLLNALFSELVHVYVCLAAVADAFSGTVTGAAVHLKNFHKVTFLIHKAVGTTGTSTITVEACTASDGTGATAIPFKYRVTVIGTSELPGSITDAAAAGFTTTAGSNQLIFIEPDARAIAALGATYQWVRVKAVEVADSPVLGGILAFGYAPRYGGKDQRPLVA